MSASKTFQDRYKGIPGSALEQLDRLQQQYGSTGSEMINAWDVIALRNPDWDTDEFPQDEKAMGALRKQLEEYAARRKKTRDIPAVSTVKTAFSQVATPPPLKKRPGSEISPPTTDAKRQLSMDQLSSVPMFVSPDFPARQEFVPSKESLEIKPANEWTERWIGTSRPESDVFLYMNASLEAITEQLRTDLTSFGEDALKRKLIPAPASRTLANTADEASKQPQEEFATDFDKLGASLQGRNVVVCGRIVCESENGKLNAKSVLLEGVNGIRVRLDLDAYRGRFSLFPGQHVIVEGVSTGSSKIRVERIFDGSINAPPASPSATQDMKVWVASGPYTGSDGLKFEYLDTLLSQVARASPDLLILMGPFVDGNHPAIMSGRPFVQVGSEIVRDVGFEDVLGFFLQRIVSSLQNRRTKVCLVPCTDEATHPVLAFPQPSLQLPDEFASNPIFVSLPNPGVFEFGHVVFGVANIDTLFDFQDEGCAVQGFDPKENMARLTSHILMQRSFYPIVPPSADSSVDLAARQNYALPPVDVLLVPSRLQAFAQDIGGVLCVNPGRSATMKTKMTVARMEIRGNKTTSEGAEGNKHGGNIAKARSKVEFSQVG